MIRTLASKWVMYGVAVVLTAVSALVGIFDIGEVNSRSRDFSLDT